MAFAVVLDACVLIPLHLSNLLLRLAEAELYEPLWTDEILDEVERNLVAKIGVTQQQSARRVHQMRAAFPAATVDGYRDLIEAMTNDPKDRHVLAAAVRGGAAMVVTNNLRDFPATALDRYDVQAVHPDDFLLDQLDLDAARVMRCLVEQRADYQRPTYSRDDFYRSLAGVVPNFIAEIVALDTAKRRGRTAAPTPLPLVIVGDDEALAAMFPGGDPDPFTPLGAAYLWLVALRAIDEFRPTLETLSVNPAAWHGYSAIVETLNGWYLTQNIVYSVEAPDQLAFAKLIPGSGSSMRAFGDAPLTEVRFLTMVRQSDRWWRVWGLTDGWTPSAADVLR